MDKRVKENEGFIEAFLKNEVASLSELIEIRGIGMIWGIDLSKLGGAETAKKVAAGCYDRHLITERAGRQNTVFKLLPPLTIERDILVKGCKIIKESIASILNSDSACQKIPNDIY